MNIPLLLEARSYLASIPDEQCNLQYYISEINLEEPLGCGTIACGLGWLCLNPKYAPHLVQHIHRNGVVDFVDHKAGSEVAGRLFDIPQDAARELFAQRCCSDYDVPILLERGEHITDKELLLARFDMLLKSEDVSMEVPQ